MMAKKIFSVVVKKKMLKKLPKLPGNVQSKFALLLKDLRDKGPKLPHWPNYSKLEGDTYHCHLGYSWAACWEYYKNQLLIEVYYVGSRENAPY